MSKKDKKDNVENKVDVFSEAKQKRLEASLSAKKAEKKEDDREKFRRYFIKIKSKLNLSADMEKVLWLHFKACGFDKEDSFDKGIRHFGYNI